jgi:hypothetical protein
VFVLILLGVPLYFMRRPALSADGAGAPDGGVVAPRRGLVRTTLDAGVPNRDVRLGPVQRVKCSAAPESRGNEGALCDTVPELDKALANGIRRNVDCAPKTGKEGTVNYVLTVDFQTRSLRIFPGASGAWRGPQAKRATQCVTRAMPELEWDKIRHKYRYYMLAIMATYPAPNPLETFPEFE